MSAAWRGFVVLLAGLALAALLNAQGLRKAADSRPSGWERSAELAVARPLARAAAWTRLDRPRHELQRAVGRADVDAIDTSVDIPVVPRKKPTLPTPTKPAPPPKPKPKPVFSRRRPLRIWVAGDSLAEVPGQALERVSAERSSLRILPLESRISTGLGRPDLYNWFKRIPTATRQLHPKVVVLSFGADDAHNYMSGVPKGKTIGKLGSPTWDAEYVRRAAGVTRELQAKGIYVVWLGLPIPRGRAFFFSFRIVNRLIKHVVGITKPGVAYVDTWHLLATPKGKYADYLREHGRLVQMRASDGIHYTQAAGDLIAQEILAKLGRVYTLKP
ncbi:MAG TPA: DUF459 domain-containing protein [Gaiellaceae bacterium]|nr:DUF459 domain-containing protein [Gaiellaceae bacterium]